MNCKTLLIIPFFLFSILVNAQESLSFKGKTYAATPAWNFICENYALTGEADIQIAKTETGGLLKISIETTDPKLQITGTTYIYLVDNTIIVCIDKKNTETVANKTVNYFNLSAIEMNKLKKTDIQSIRFNISGTTNKFSSQIGNFTAVNKKSYYATKFDKSKNSFNTAEEITAL
ncbi:hypothetical protein QWY99_10850 [Flavobacterium branchiarum]|uniref:Auto-transporter adhesin head GIN domain-containing protein n=1 Tax=Flavobacterium branchiarum TaxID=1114870 RepID=A0ABV5FG36_9FLAO|nr:hypothetical protein [Flavobacterium branchiarum]MDN3673551.1 hypothetical protein [Flavobacterium branchiarum]